MTISRRVFVKSGGLALVSLGLDPLFLARAAFASGRPTVRPSDRPTLVCLFQRGAVEDRKSTRLNSSHVRISYAVFCLKKKKNNQLHCLRLLVHVRSHS